MKEVKLKIGVVGIGRGAGATLIAVSLAYLLAGKENYRRQENWLKRQKKNNLFSFAPGCVSYVEFWAPASGEELFYYGAALDKHFSKRRFTDFFKLYREGSLVNTKINFYKGVNWIVHRQWEERRKREDDFPVKQLAGQYIVADGPPLERLREFDVILAVIDPLPSKLLAGAAVYEALREAEQSGSKIRWLLNKDNEDVNHRELKHFLQLKDYISVPLLPQQIFYRSQYTCRLAAEEILKDETACGVLETLAEELAILLKESENFMK